VQINPFGRSPGGRIGDKVAAHIGGYFVTVITARPSTGRAGAVHQVPARTLGSKPDGAGLGENDRVTIATETLAEVALDKVSVLGANDGARSSFTAWAGDWLIALDPGLNVLGRWRAGRQHHGYHATCPGRGLALISGLDEVRLLDHAGRVRWRYPHPPWNPNSALESGCAWFDDAGQPYAVVPAASYDHCLVLRLEPGSGRPLAQARIEARPAGIVPVHHLDGWVGLSEGEGQDAARTWWVRSAPQPGGQAGIEVLDADWPDWILTDVDPAGAQVITTPHGCFLSTALVVRSFPGHEIVRSVEPPPGEHWDCTAFFAGDMIVNALTGPEHGQRRFVAVNPHGKIADLNEDQDASLRPAAGGTWLSATCTTIRLRRMARNDEEIPGQISLW
jgi:hypothetical protein